MSARDEKPETEETSAGSQTLMRGVAPITLRDRLAVLAAAPMAPRAAQKRCDVGLFDLESRRQIDLVDELRRVTREAARNPEPSATGE
ncbi:hypothetical protein ACFOOP_11460 [Marinicaulis aureus]|uniref:Uncharacterized protein n=1 Tax=Hyphococcus aureus TaxID=2666033 RepID=A0ABW1KZL3_9PROT